MSDRADHLALSPRSRHRPLESAALVRYHALHLGLLAELLARR